MGAQEVELQGVGPLIDRACLGRARRWLPATRASRASRELSARVASRNLRQAAVINQPFGSAGGSVGHVASARTRRLLHGVLGRREVGSATDEDTGDRGNQLPQQGFVHSATVGAEP